MVLWQISSFGLIAEPLSPEPKFNDLRLVHKTLCGLALIGFMSYHSTTCSLSSRYTASVPFLKQV